MSVPEGGRSSETGLSRFPPLIETRVPQVRSGRTGDIERFNMAVEHEHVGVIVMPVLREWDPQRRAVACLSEDRLRILNLCVDQHGAPFGMRQDRKSTRLNSS